MLLRTVVYFSRLLLTPTGDLGLPRWSWGATRATGELQAGPGRGALRAPDAAVADLFPRGPSRRPAPVP